MCSVTDKILHFSFYFPISPFLKSPLTALIVTGFCCFSVSKHACTKKAHWDFGGGGKIISRVNAPLSGCDMNLYSQSKIKAVSRSEVVFFYSSVCSLSGEHVRTWQVSLNALLPFKISAQRYFKETLHWRRGGGGWNTFNAPKALSLLQMGIKIWEDALIRRRESGLVSLRQEQCDRTHVSCRNPASDLTDRGRFC